MSGLTQQQVDTCTIEGCDRELLCRGVCNAHYRWFRRRGQMVGRTPVGACRIDGCEKPHKGHGLCGMHYQRFKKYGDPGPAERLLAPTGSSWMVGRYLAMTSASHPLANRAGTVYVHRVVLYEAIGPGEHPCWNCARLVSWDLTAPFDELGLTVDHIDCVTTNNAPENLRPSCQSCNSSRRNHE